MTDTARRARKAVDFMRMYGASEIMVGRRTGTYPIPFESLDLSALEQRVLAHGLSQ